MTLRTLILEDLADMRAWLSGVMLEACPEARIATAPDIRAALGMLEGESFDLALVDLGLPDGSGLDVLPRAQGERPAHLVRGGNDHGR